MIRCPVSVQIGQRAYVGLVCMDRNSKDFDTKSLEQNIADTESFIASTRSAHFLLRHTRRPIQICLWDHLCRFLVDEPTQYVTRLGPRDFTSCPGLHADATCNRHGCGNRLENASLHSPRDSTILPLITGTLQQ